MHFSLNWATVHTSNASNSRWALNCQLISAKNNSYRGFFPLIMLKNQLIVSVMLKATFPKGFSVVLKPFALHCHWKPMVLTPVRCSAAGHVIPSPVAADPCTEWQHCSVIPAFLKTILPAVFLVFKMRLYGGKILDEMIIITIIIITIINLSDLGHMYFPEVISSPKQKANKNKHT